MHIGQKRNLLLVQNSQLPFQGERGIIVLSRRFGSAGMKIKKGGAWNGYEKCIEKYPCQG